jgi:hypothetical protein
MKKYLISFIAILGAITGFSQTHFTDAHAGTNAEAYMSIYIFSGQLGGINLQTGDEIAIFDGNICVGDKVLTGPLTSTVSVKAAKKDAGLSNGYTIGHPISVKIWDSSASKEYTSTVVIRSDSPYSVFTDNESAYIDISAKKSLTINMTAQNKVYDGTDNATVGYSISGGSISGNVTITASNGKFNSKNVGTGKAVVGTLTVSGTDAGNYDFTKVEATIANITALPITITADAKSKTYGDADPIFTGQVTSGSVLAGDVVSGTMVRVAGTSVNTYAINQGTYTYGSNYVETFISANLTITAKALSIKPNAKSKSYGDSDPDFTYVSTPSLVPGDVLSGTLSRVSGESINSYSYTLGTLSGGSNYSLTLDATNVFTIIPKALTLSGLSVVTKSYDGNTSATLSGTASLSGIVGSESVALSGTPLGTYASASAGNAVPVNISGYSLSGPNAGNYTLNTTISGNITPKALTVSGAVAQDKVYDGTTAAVITGAILSGKVGSDVVTVTTPATGIFAQKGVGNDISVSATMTLSGAAASNYSLTYPTGLKASITKKNLIITAKNQSKCLGSTINFSGTEILAPDLASGDAITSATLSSTGSMTNAIVGVYDIVVSNALGKGLENYTISYANGKLTVENLPVPTITGSAPVTQVPAQVVYTTEAGMSNYVWSITSGGTISAGAGSRQVKVNWSNMTNQSITVTYVNGNGCSGTYTRAITLSPLPTAALSGSTSVCSGTSATLSVSLTGLAPWRITYSDGTNSKTITGISTSPYTFEVTPATNTTTTYTITSVMDANDMTNTGTGSTNVTALPIIEAPVVVAVSDLCYGSNDAVIRATVSGTQSAAVVYQWQSSVDNITWTDISNSNTLNYSPGELYNSVYYRVSAFISGCEAKVSNAIKVNVHEPITNAIVSCEKQTLCFGDAPEIITSTPSSGGNGTFNYQWQQKTSGTWVNVGSNSLTYRPSSLTTTTTFRVITRDKGIPSCGSVYSNELVITVKDPILAGKISTDQKITIGAVPAPFTSVTPGSGSGSITYAWEMSLDDGITWTRIQSAENATYTAGAITQPTWFRRITISTENKESCTAASDPVKISLWSTGLDNPENNGGKLTVYAIKNIGIYIKGNVSAQAIATLYDLAGKTILIKNLEEGELNIIQTQGIRTGIYLVSIRDNEKTQGFKVPLKE